MLVLSRKEMEKVRLVIGNLQITVIVLEFRGDKIRLGFDAPAEVVILREEIVPKEEAT